MPCFLLLAESSFLAPSHFSFLSSLPFPLKGFIFVCLAFTSLQAIIQRMYVGRESGTTVSAMYYVMLCQTDLPDARGGSLTEQFGVASFIVIEHPHLSN